jgi:choline dehydrogenase-like flavoprotein
LVLTELEQKTLEGDICIIGAGAAGITIAREFINSSHSVILLESGGLEIEAETQALYEGESVGRDYFTLDTTRLRYFGGSTNHWGGMCAPLFPITFEKRPWVPMSGWPFDYAHLVPYYLRAQSVCELGPLDYSTDRLEYLLASQRLPLEPEQFSTFVIQYSPPTRFGEKYDKDLRAAPNVKVVLNANVLELEANDSLSSLRRVSCRTLSGKDFFVTAKHFVLATGGIENPRILLLSNKQQAAGLGNDNGLVGRNFIEHPHLRLGQILPATPRFEWTMYDGERWRRKPGVRASCHITPSEALQRQERLASSTISLWPNRTDWDDGLTEYGRRFFNVVGLYLRNNGLIENRSYRSIFASDKPLESFDVTVSFEQVPNLESRVSLSRDKDFFGQNRVELDWALTKFDMDSVERTVELFARQIGKMGIGRMRVDVQADDWPAGHHHMGTTRMHQDPKHGVVNADCRLHSLENLYVAGSSVFPTGGTVNPTLTIVALALRLSDHLKGQLT